MFEPGMNTWAEELQAAQKAAMFRSREAREFVDAHGGDGPENVARLVLGLVVTVEELQAAALHGGSAVAVLRQMLGGPAEIAARLVRLSTSAEELDALQARAFLTGAERSALRSRIERESTGWASEAWQLLGGEVAAGG